MGCPPIFLETSLNARYPKSWMVFKGHLKSEGNYGKMPSGEQVQFATENFPSFLIGRSTINYHVQ